MPEFSRRNPSSIYKFPLIKTEAEKEQEMNLIASQQVISAKQQSRVKQVTHDLVQWAEQLVSAYSSCTMHPRVINYDNTWLAMHATTLCHISSNDYIYRVEVKTLPISMSKPSRVCLVAIMKPRYILCRICVGVPL